MAKHSEDKIKLIQLDYENGKSISELSLLYGVSQGTIKYWSSNNSWVKKKQNQPTKKPTNRKKKNKTNQKKVVGKTKDIQIKQDILSDVPKEVIMEKHGIKKSAYYIKEKSIRELITNRTKTILEEVSDEMIPDKKGKLREIKETKFKLLDMINQSIIDGDDKKMNILDDRLTVMIKAEKEIYKELRMQATYQESTFEKELAEEQIQKERLEIERSKLKDKTKETENESKSLDLLNKLVGDSNATNK